MRTMVERSASAEILIGVLLGGVFGYLYFAEGGRRLVDQVDEWLDDASEQMRRLQETAARARETIEEGRRVVRAIVVRAISDVARDMRHEDAGASASLAP